MYQCCAVLPAITGKSMFCACLETSMRTAADATGISAAAAAALEGRKSISPP